MNKKIWFISDTHFHHDKNFLYEPRGFNNIYDHDKNIINNWNNMITPFDEVYHLGDVMLEDNEYGLNILKNLNGQIHIILGNHDSDTRAELYKQCANVVEVTYAKRLKIGKHLFWLSHYPTITTYIDKKKTKEHLICLHGHLHDTNKFYNNNPYIYNVALDAHNNKPVTIEEILEDIKIKKEEILNEITSNNN